MSATKRKRLDLFVELNHFYEAYHALSLRILTSIEKGEYDLVVRLIELRRQTQIRVDSFLESHPELLVTPLKQEKDVLVIKVRRHIRSLVEECQTLSGNIHIKMKELREAMRNSAGKMAKGQKCLKGYSTKQKKTAVYFESTK